MLKISLLYIQKWLRYSVFIFLSLGEKAYLRGLSGLWSFGNIYFKPGVKCSRTPGTHTPTQTRTHTHAHRSVILVILLIAYIKISIDFILP